jgi:hypothetical protein
VVLTRQCLIALSLFVAACGGTTEPATPTGPSLAATLHYASGDSLRVSGTSGYWYFDTGTQAGSVIVGASTAYAPAGDSARPSLVWITFGFEGPAFARFPIQYSGQLEAPATDAVGALVNAQPGPYHVDSGTVSVTPLGGAYARVAFSAWCSAYDPAFGGAPFKLVGVLEVPHEGPYTGLP